MPALPDHTRPGPGFQGRVAIVTGGGSGIGEAACTLFAAQGAQVVVVDRDGDAASRVAAEIEGAGGEALPIAADISKEQDTLVMAADAFRRFRRLDCLFANAAIHGGGSVTSASIDAWDEVMATNLRGSFLTVRACLPYLLESGHGAIVMTSSDSIVQAAVEEAAYTTSKFALVGLARSIAVDYGPQGIRANVLVPGVTDTKGLREAFSSGGRTLDVALRQAAEMSPMRRIGQPLEVAEVAVFLCSDRASLINGATIHVDGGMTVAYPG